MMAIDSSVEMTTITDKEDLKVGGDILEIRKTDHVSPSSAIHVLMRGINM